MIDNSNPLIEEYAKLLGELPDDVNTINLPLQDGSGLVRLGLVMAIDYSTLPGAFVETANKDDQYPELYTDSTAQNLIIIQNPNKYQDKIKKLISKKELRQLQKIYENFIQATPKDYIIIELDLQEPLYHIGFLHKIKYLGMNGRIADQAFIHTHGEPFVPKLYVNQSNDIMIATEYINVTDRGIENTTKPYIKRLK